MKIPCLCLWNKTGRGVQAAYGNQSLHQKKFLPWRYTCTLSFSTNDWNRWFLIISLIFCGETKGIKLCIKWKLIRDRKNRKQPDRLLFHNWLIQRIPLPFSEIVFRPITQTCKFSFHSKKKCKLSVISWKSEMRQDTLGIYESLTLSCLKLQNATQTTDSLERYCQSSQVCLQ